MKQSVLRPGVMKRLWLSFACLVMVFGLVLGPVSRVEVQTLTKGTMFVFSQDGNALASVGEDGRITVVDLASGEERVTLAGDFGGVVTAPAFSPDGKTLAGVAQGSITQKQNNCCDICVLGDFIKSSTRSRITVVIYVYLYQ